MGFVRMSRQIKEEQLVVLNNIFIQEYMPVAPENYTKVYIMGLGISASLDNEVESIAIALGIDTSLVMDAFAYWQSQGLVNVTLDPLAVEYLPIVPIAKRIKKFSKEKYKTFNDQLHAMVKDRNILPNEYNEYYSIMESLGIEVEAMLIIIGYCIRLKGSSVGYQYILAVARNIASAGCRTYERVSEYLTTLDLYDEDLKAVLKTLKVRAKPDHNDKNLLHKWKKELGFSQELVIQVAKKVTKGGMQTLDMLLCRYYENRLFSLGEIEEYNKNREMLFSITREILKILGLRYDSLDYIIETYISPYLREGFSCEALKLIADYCFRGNIRTLELFNSTVKRFYKQGLVSVESINSFLRESIVQDDTIKSLFAKLNVYKTITSYDREYYKTWTKDWAMSDDLLEYATTLSKDKASAVSYMNSILASWFDKKITTLNQAKATSEIALTKNNSASFTPTNSDNLVNRNLSAEELNAMFDRLENDEL